MVCFVSLPVVAALVLGQPCGACHETQHESWKLSLHARAASDPLYLAMRVWAREDAGEELAARCANCHSVADVSGGERVAGVTCEVCHQGVQHAPGPSGWAVDGDAAVRANRAVEAPHPVVHDHRLADNRLCLVCHREKRTPNGIAVCTTGSESEGRPAGATCTTCHMPATSHAFPGGSPETLRRAALLTAERRGRELRVTVVNRGTGHALPTGSPLRQIRLEVTFLNPAGQATADNPSDRGALFARTLRDDAGTSPVPPWRANAIASDSRLAPGERRTFTYPIPGGASSVTARLVYHRAPAPLLERLGLADHPLAQPEEMARFELQL